jgi:hypothetical protein
MREDELCVILFAVEFFRKLGRALLAEDTARSNPAEVVIWPAASNNRRLVAVCSACHKAVRSGFTSQSVSGPYHHRCTELKSR